MVAKYNYDVDAQRLRYERTGNSGKSLYIRVILIRINRQCYIQTYLLLTLLLITYSGNRLEYARGRGRNPNLRDPSQLLRIDKYKIKGGNEVGSGLFQLFLDRYSQITIRLFE